MEAELLASISVEDYLQQEKLAAIKHEYLDGQIFAMAGASDDHNIVAGNIFVALKLASRSKACQTYISDMKLRVNEQTFYYPDIMLICEDDAEPYYKEKPCVVIEVISRSTARTDLSEKLHAYLKLDSLKLYLLVNSRQAWVKGYYRSGNGWQERLFDKADEIPLPCADINLSFEDIYAQSGID
ncbi:MAG: Uma2 family endonuclease [Deinococcales bacterium]